MVKLIGSAILAIAAVVGTTLRAEAQDKPPDSRRTISVTGQAEVSASPDLAIVTVAVVSQKEKAADAASDNATRTAKVIAALKGLIAKDDKLTTTGYSLDPQYAPIKNGEPNQPRIVGYVANNQVQVETHKIDAVGSFIDSAIAAGANNIAGLQFTLANRNDQLGEALAKAGAEARAQGESIASALGVKLKGVVSATTGGWASPVPHPMPRFARAMEVSAPTSIEPGAVTVSATLQVTYEIE